MLDLSLEVSEKRFCEHAHSLLRLEMDWIVVSRRPKWEIHRVAKRNTSGRPICVFSELVLIFGLCGNKPVLSDSAPMGAAGAPVLYVAIHSIDKGNQNFVRYLI